MPDIEMVSHGPWRKKHVMFNETMCKCIEADAETYPRISQVLEPDSFSAENTEMSPRPLTFLVPYEEFRELVFGLPDFGTLPLRAVFFLSVYATMQSPTFL